MNFCRDLNYIQRNLYSQQEYWFYSTKPTRLLSPNKKQSISRKCLCLSKDSQSSSFSESEAGEEAPMELEKIDFQLVVKDELDLARDYNFMKK